MAEEPASELRFAHGDVSIGLTCLTLIETEGGMVALAKCPVNRLSRNMRSPPAPKQRATAPLAFSMPPTRRGLPLGLCNCVWSGNALLRERPESWVRRDERAEKHGRGFFRALL